MEMLLSEVGGVRKIALSGRLDSAGVDVIETRFTAATVPVGANILVDLSQVAFLASLGVRMFISTTRALSWKGAKMVLFGANPAVMETIETMGFDDIVPVVPSEAEALALLAE
jgi:anti-sigma B factor antagonist